MEYIQVLSGLFQIFYANEWKLFNRWKVYGRLLVLDVKPDSYFKDRGINNQHGYGGYLFVRDKDIMGWLFGQIKNDK